MNQTSEDINLSWKPQRKNHEFKLINKIILTKLFLCYYKKDAPTPCFLPTPTGKDAPTPWIFLPAPIDKDATTPLYSNHYWKEAKTSMQD